MYISEFISLLLCASFGVGTAVPINAQTAEFCVTSSYENFLLEIESKERPLTEKGLDYLTAYGWVQATKVCMAHTTYSASKQMEAANFKNRIDSLTKAIEVAIRSNALP